MRLRPAAAFLLVSLTPFAASAMTVDATAQPGQRRVTDASGVPVPAGVAVWVGRLTDGFAPQADLAAVRAHWQTFGETTTRSLAGEAGRFSASISRDAPEFSLQPVYFLIQQTLGGAAPAAGGANVTAWALFTGSAAAWLFPDNDALPPGNAVTLTSSSVTLAWGGSLTAGDLRLSTALATPAQAYDAWAAATFPAGTPAADRLPAADPDHDGLANAFECLHSTRPLVPDAPPASGRLLTAPERWRFSYPRNPALPASYDLVQVSSDLAFWAAPTPATVTRSEANGVVDVQITLPPTTRRYFSRLTLPWLPQP